MGEPKKLGETPLPVSFRSRESCMKSPRFKPEDAKYKRHLFCFIMNNVAFQHPVALRRSDEELFPVSSNGI
jgi:hypothetical protein